MTGRKHSLLFLQLPQLDNDVVGPRENLPVAAFHLAHALQQTAEGRHWRIAFVPPAAEDAGNAELARLIAARRPDAIACTLYLWNIERTLRVLAQVRALLPAVRLIAGGPETARPHPFLYRRPLFDAVAVGEGEGVFAAMLRHVRGGPAPEFRGVAVRRGRRYRWGRGPAPVVALDQAVPPAAVWARRVQDRAIAYLETTRGCPMHCTYCRYHHLRPGTICLAPAQVAARVRALCKAGFREIRFVDPTFNGHPRFDDVIKVLVRLNGDRVLRFFAEIKGEAVTAPQAEHMARAGFAEVEIGLQSVDPAVLRNIRRPTRLDALEAGIRRLAGCGINVTLDIMYGLPGQTAADVRRSVAWGRRLGPGVRVQCLQTLLLPGTVLRAQAARWGIAADPRPPYAVRSTATLTAGEMTDIEAFIAASDDLPAGTSTTRFVGVRLPDLFAERHELEAAALRPDTRLPGRSHRRALIFVGRGLFARGDALRRVVRRAVREDPDALWQFVLAAQAEEPLDLLDGLIETLRSLPSHILDRYASAALTQRMAARRLFVQLRPGRRYDAGWRAAAEDLLRATFL